MDSTFLGATAEILVFQIGAVSGAFRACSRLFLEGKVLALGFFARHMQGTEGTEGKARNESQSPANRPGKGKAVTWHLGTSFHGFPMKPLEFFQSGCLRSEALPALAATPKA